MKLKKERGTVLVKDVICLVEGKVVRYQLEDLPSYEKDSEDE